SAPALSEAKLATTAAPSAARCVAMEAPIPLEAPVTTATLSASFFVVLLFISFSRLLVVGPLGCWSSVDRVCLREKFVLGPPAAECLDELDRSGEALAGELGVGALGLEGVSAGVHDFEVTNDAGAIAVGGES